LAFCVLPIASFLLSGYPETAFYVSLVTVSIPVLILLKQYYKDSQQLLDFDENLTPKALLVVAAGIMSMIVVSSLMSRLIPAKSFLYIPTHNLALSYGQIFLPSFPADILFTAVLVVPGEELAKLVVILATYLWIKQRLGHLPAMAISVVVGVGGWALLHTFRNPDYQGPYAALMVLSAAIAGIIMVVSMKYTKCLLVGVLQHLGYNTYAIFLFYYGGFNFIPMPQMIGVIVLGIFPLILKTYFSSSDVQV
jgi:hypothetical protein